MEDLPVTTADRISYNLTSSAPTRVNSLRLRKVQPKSLWRRILVRLERDKHSTGESIRAPSGKIGRRTKGSNDSEYQIVLYRVPSANLGTVGLESSILQAAGRISRLPEDLLISGTFHDI